MIITTIMLNTVSLILVVIAFIFMLMALKNFKKTEKLMESAQKQLEDLIAGRKW